MIAMTLTTLIGGFVKVIEFDGIVRRYTILVLIFNNFELEYCWLRCVTVLLVDPVVSSL